MIKLASTAIVSLILILLANPGATIAAETTDKSAKEHVGKFAVRVPAVECNGGCSFSCRSVCQPDDGCSALVCCWDGASSCWSTPHIIE
jgi:hypothetical protein